MQRCSVLSRYSNRVSSEGLGQPHPEFPEQGATEPQRTPECSSLNRVVGEDSYQQRLPCLNIRNYALARAKRNDYQLLIWERHTHCILTFTSVSAGSLGRPALVHAQSYSRTRSSQCPLVATPRGPSSEDQSPRRLFPTQHGKGNDCILDARLCDASTTSDAQNWALGGKEPRAE